MTRYLRERTLRGPLIEQEPETNLGLVVVLPAKDEPELVLTLESLKRCQPPSCAVEVIVVVNTGERDGEAERERNGEIAAEAREWGRENSGAGMRFWILEQHNLPAKHAGVGLARKIGMDEACFRLESSGNSEGIIACFDADSECDSDYLVEVASLFQTDESCDACSIYFEHPLEGNRESEATYEAIVHYELHLRYFVHAQRWAGFPQAVQTIGSSMAVRCRAYQEQNGMNRRQAGEDFYFLHKFTPLGGVRELTSTRVIPSPRPSHRVPFGTGRAVGKMLATPKPECLTYAPASFRDLRHFLLPVDLYQKEDPAQLPDTVASFLETLAWRERLAEIRGNVKTPAAFRQRFFRWFNAFQVMKYLHFARDAGYEDVPVGEAASWLLGELGEEKERMELRDCLAAFRRLDREG